MQVMQLQALVLLCDLITMQDCPSAGQNIAVDHEQTLGFLLQHLPEELPFVATVKSIAALLGCNGCEQMSIENAMLDIATQDAASADIVAACVNHCICQQELAAASTGILQSIQRFGSEVEPVLRCLLAFKVRTTACALPSLLRRCSYCHVSSTCRNKGLSHHVVHRSRPFTRRAPCALWMHTHLLGLTSPQLLCRSSGMHTEMRCLRF